MGEPSFLMGMETERINHPAVNGTAAHEKRPGRVARALMKGVRAYQLLFSAWIGGQCRFEPTCSHYAIQALRDHGATGGSYLAARRILRCNPLCRGGHDPVPQQPAARASRAHHDTHVARRG